MNTQEHLKLLLRASGCVSDLELQLARIRACCDAAWKVLGDDDDDANKTALYLVDIAAKLCGECDEDLKERLSDCLVKLEEAEITEQQQTEGGKPC